MTWRKTALALGATLSLASAAAAQEYPADDPGWELGAARLTLRASRAGARAFDLGFSDRASCS